MGSPFAWYADDGSAVVRPAPLPHAPLPPFDPDDAGGQVHTVPPHELIIPAHFADPLFLRADFNGVTLDLQRWGIPTPPAGRTLNDIVGGNSTPAAMLMTPMLILYPRTIQDACLTEHAERGYDDFVISGDGWNLTANGLNPTPAAIVSWALYVQSWGFRVVYWAATPMLSDPTLNALVAAHALSFAIPGEEVDTKTTREQYDAVLKSTLGVVGHGIPVGAHFSSNYPDGFPRDTFLTNWSDYDGWVHLMWQADQHDPAGTQGARLYYARERVALGAVGGNGLTALNSRVIAFETMASAELYGQCDEPGGCLKSLELLYTTRNDPRIPPVSGFGNGCRLPSGAPL
jgi:hypothetical protein